MTTEDEQERQKHVAFYSAAVAAWFTTKFEKDKNLLSLSTAGIGLTVTLVTTADDISICAALMFACASAGFITCIMAVLIIFNLNARRLEEAIKGESGSESHLILLDTVAGAAFLVGVLFSILAGIVMAIHSI